VSRTRLSRLGVAAAAGLTTLTLTVAACGSSGGNSSSATTTEAPEDKIVPDAQVTADLAATQATMAKLAADPTAATDQALDDLFNGWVGYEGTVKKNEVEMYLSFEDALAAFTKAGKAKDAAAMTAAAATFADTAKAYLAKHP
jgi:hypothetical protein